MKNKLKKLYELLCDDDIDYSFTVSCGKTGNIYGVDIFDGNGKKMYSIYTNGIAHLCSYNNDDHNDISIDTLSYIANNILEA